ncbi:MAG: immunoglobulin domain-containing protein, partial [Phycisphaerales bacterium]
ADDLERLIALRPIRARRASVAKRAWMFARRNRGTLAGSVATGVIVAVLAGVLLGRLVLAPRWAAADVARARTELLAPGLTMHVFLSVMHERPTQADPHATQVLNRALAHYDAAMRFGAAPRHARVERAGVLAALAATLPPLPEAGPPGTGSRAARAVADALRARGLAAFLLGDMASALDAWARLDALDGGEAGADSGGGDALVAAGQGLLYLHDEQHARAYPRLDRAVREFPAAAFLRVRLAEAAARCGDTDRAARLLDAAERAGPDPYSGTERVRALVAAAAGRHDEARARYEALLKDAGGDFVNHALYQYAQYLESRGEREAAVRVYARAIGTGLGYARPRAALARAAEAWWTGLTARERAGHLRGAVDTGNAPGTLGEVFAQLAWVPTTAAPLHPPPPPAEGVPESARAGEAISHLAHDEAAGPIVAQTSTAPPPSASGGHPLRSGAEGDAPVPSPARQSGQSRPHFPFFTQIPPLFALTSPPDSAPFITRASCMEVARALEAADMARFNPWFLSSIPSWLKDLRVAGWGMPAASAPARAADWVWTRLTRTAHGRPLIGAALAAVVGGGGAALVPATDASGQPMPPCGQAAWTQVATTGPAARYRHAMAGNATHAVLFGGVNNANTILGDTWLWSGSAWAQAAPATSPPARYLGTMCYDRARDEVLLFGGFAGGPPSVVGDTWAYKNGDWTLRSTTGPSPRYGAMMAFDSHRNVVVLFGGDVGGNQTWEWDGAVWTLRSVSGPPTRTEGFMVYDALRRRTVMGFGVIPGTGTRYQDCWLWDGATWTSGPTPPGPTRYGVAGAFDADRGKVVIVGGHDGNFSDTTAEFGTTWTVQPVPGPEQASFTSLVYFEPHRRHVLFGGDNSNAAGFLGNTWVYAASDAPTVYTPPEGTSACYGGERTLSVIAVGSATLTYQWRKDGMDLVDGPTGSGSIISGATSPTLTLGGTRPDDAGDYDCVITNTCGGATTEAAAFSVCVTEYNCDGSLNPDDLGDYITDYYTTPHIPGPGGYALPCPENEVPYDAGYKVNYTLDGSPQCHAPNPDNLGDFITEYYGSVCN